MPGLNVVVSADADPFYAELRRVQTLAAESGKKIGHSLSGGGLAGATGRGGVIGELLVIMREIGRGNWSRIPGSISILVSRLGWLKYILGPLGIALAAVGTAGYFTIKAFKAMADGAQALNDITGGTSQKFHYLAEAMNNASKRTQEFNDWIRTLADSHKTLTDNLELKLKLMKEEQEMQQKLSGEKGATPVQLEAGKIKNLQEQKDLITKTGYEVAKAQSDAGLKARIAEKEANDFNAEANIKDLEERQKKAADIYDKVQDAANKGTGGFLNNFRRYSQYDIKVDGETQTVELNQAKKTYEALNAQVQTYLQKQKGLEDTAKKTKEEYERQTKAVTKLNELRKDNAEKLELEKKYGPEIAKNEKHKLEIGNLTSLQRVGAYTAPGAIALLDVSKKSEQHLKVIKDHITKNSIPKISGDNGGAKF